MLQRLNARAPLAGCGGKETDRSGSWRIKISIKENETQRLSELMLPSTRLVILDADTVEHFNYIDQWNPG